MNAKTIRTAAMLLLTIMTLLLPVFIYAWTFGLNISADHTRWGEMGSALAGIYTPLLTLLTLLILALQVRLQTQANSHLFDQSFLQDCRADIDYYLDHLLVELEAQVIDGPKLRQRLVIDYTNRLRSRLTSPQAQVEALELSVLHPRCLAIWGAIHSVLSGLSANIHQPYTSHYTTTVHKCIAILSFEVCVALNNFAHSASNERAIRGYKFSKDFA